ncbi:hypothetical protein cypCar_00019555, partial [Cyprinus carpio]
MAGGPDRWPRPMGCVGTAPASTAAGGGHVSPGASANRYVSTDANTENAWDPTNASVIQVIQEKHATK